MPGNEHEDVQKGESIKQLSGFLAIVFMLNDELHRKGPTRLSGCSLLLQSLLRRTRHGIAGEPHWGKMMMNRRTRIRMHSNYADEY
jgi:hypothetical protein